MKHYQDYLTSAKQQISEIDPVDLSRADRLLIDVREAEEYLEGFIPGARLVPRGLIEQSIETLVPYRNAPITLYCAVGNRSALAALTLQEMGYRDVVSLRGGIRAYTSAGLPLAKPEGLDADARRRYQRHLRIPEIGETGQERLQKAKVLVVGAGGLGCPAALYLAAAGVGTIGICDDDAVELSNLQRQILHRTVDIGRAKVDSAFEAIRSRNPTVRVIPVRERLGPANAAGLIADYDLILDGADNFGTRYLLNDVAKQGGKPLVHGSVYRFEGQVTTFLPDRGPCYRCLFRHPPAAGVSPSCAEAGVLGVLPGVIGLLQAVEALKLLLRLGEPLSGRLLCYDALPATFREIRFERDPACATCGEEPNAIDPKEYDMTCTPAEAT